MLHQAPLKQDDDSAFIVDARQSDSQVEELAFVNVLLLAKYIDVIDMIILLA